MLAAAMAPGLPIHRSTFFAGGNIGPVLPTNLLRMDELKQTWGDFVASCSFGGTWAILLLPGSFGSTFWETIFLVEAYLLFVFLSFGSFG
jgi:hypothetical protein